MDSVITGKVWKFGDDINTDIISPAEYMDASYEVIGKHAMERAFPGFADAIARGDIIVAGKNFGSGSSRETAQIALIYAGVGAVIASVVYDMGSGIVAGKQKSSLAIMAAAFLAVCIFNVNVVYVVIFCIALGVVRTLIQKRKEKKR